MTALYIILGIIAFFVIVLSIPVVLDLEYTDAVRCKVSWLFLKFDLYPFPEKKKKEETEKSNHQRISLSDPVAWSGSSVYMEK